MLSVRYLHCIIQTYFKTVTFYDKYFFLVFNFFLLNKCLYFLSLTCLNFLAFIISQFLFKGSS